MILKAWEAPTWINEGGATKKMHVHVHALHNTCTALQPEDICSADRRGAARSDPFLCRKWPVLEPECPEDPRIQGFARGLKSILSSDFEGTGGTNVDQ